MVAIEHRSASSATTSASILSPTSNTSVTSASTTSAASTSLSTLSTTATATTANTHSHKKMSSTSDAGSASKSAVSQRDVEVKVSKKKTPTSKDTTALDLSKKVLKLDLSGKEVEEYSMKSPKSPIVGKCESYLKNLLKLLFD